MNLGFDPGQYRLVLNRSLPKKAIEEQYSRLFAYQKLHKEFWLNPNCVLPSINAFEAVVKKRSLGRTPSALA